MSSRVAVGVSRWPSHRAGFYLDPAQCPSSSAHVARSPPRLSCRVHQAGDASPLTALLTFRLLGPPRQAHGEGPPGDTGPSRLTGRARQGTGPWLSETLLQPLVEQAHAFQLTVQSPSEQGRVVSGMSPPDLVPRGAWAMAAQPLDAPQKLEGARAAPALLPQPCPASALASCCLPSPPNLVPVFACLDPSRCGHQTHSPVLGARAPASAYSVPTPGRRSALCLPL